MRSERLVWGGVAVFACLYLAQSLSPLRLEHDSTIYFRIAMSLVGLEEGPETRFPMGYPAYLAFLDKAGLATSFVIVFTNALFLAMGFVAMRNIFPTVSRATYGLIVLLSLLSFPVIRSVVMPLPEAAYFAASMTGISAMSIASRKRDASALPFFAAALVVIAAAIALRTIGVLLGAAFIWSCWMVWRNRSNDPATVWGSRLAFASGAAVTVATFLMSDSGTINRYAGYIKGQWAVSLDERIFIQMKFILISLGQMGINLPQIRLELPEAPVRLLGVAVGIILMFSIRGRRITPAGVYAGAYVILLFIWPGQDIRLWMPLIPLLIAFVVTAASRAHLNRWITTAAIAWFVLTGSAAVAWLTRQSVSGDDFARLYNPMTTTGYEDKNPTHDADVMRILHHYDPQQAAARAALGPQPNLPIPR